MAQDRSALRTEAAVERRPAASVVQRSPSAPAQSPARGLQQRLGNQAMQALVARSAAAPSSQVPAPVAVSVSSAPGIQRLTPISSPHDPAELEAHETARKVMRMADPAPAAVASTGAAGTVQRDAAPGAGSAPSAVHVNISGGSPLPQGVRGFMEPRFGASFANVRIHTGETAARQSAEINAHAFTVGEHVFFGRGKFQPESASGRELIAHELTHTIQQGGAMQRSVDTTVTERSEPRVQRLGIGDALDWIADKASFIPGFRLLTIVLGMNPINLAPVARNAANLLRALLEMIPVTGPLLVMALDNYGIFAKAGAWIEAQIKTMGLVGGGLKAALDKFLATLKWSDIFDMGGVWERAKLIFTEPIGRLVAFAGSVASDVLGFIRQAVLLPLARLAEGTRGYDLLKALLGEDPITGEPVPRTPATLIGGFMKLIGKEEIWENLQKANAVPRAWAWFQGATASLMGFVRQVPVKFMAVFKSLEIMDFILLPKAYIKIYGAFGGIVVDFLSWAAGAAFKLLEIIFEVLAPSVVPYLKKAGDAFHLIVSNPIGFIKNLVAAIVGGIQAFVANIWTHLKTGFVQWLFGALADAGIEIPEGLPSLPAILKLVMNVLGLTMARLKIEATKLLGPTAVAVIEKLVEYVQAFWAGGPAGLWAKIKDDLGNLKDMAIDAIQSWLITTIVKQAVIKLVSFFNPAGAFIQAILAIYNTIQVVIERISQIAAFVGAVVNSIYDIATGAIGGAIKWIESALAGAIPLVLSFLAGLLGLGGLTEKVRDTLEKAGNFVWDAIRKLIMKGIDAVKRLFGKGAPKEKDKDKKGEEGHVAIAEEAGAHLVDMPLPEGSVEDAKKAVQAEGNKIAPTYAGRIQTGSKMTVEFVDPPTELKEREIDFKVVIAPNKTELVFKRAKGNFNECAAGTYAALIKLPNKNPDNSIQEAHHVPQVEFAASLGAALIDAGDDLGGKNGTILKNAGKTFMDKVTGHGPDLPAVLMHEKTHTARGGGTRVHGSELRKEFAKYKVFTKKEEGDVARTKSGEIAVKPGGATFERQMKQVAGDVTGKSVTTEAQLSAALGKEGPEIVERVYNAEEARSVGAVEIALANSTMDGSGKGRRSAIATVKSLIKSTWKTFVDMVTFT